MPLRADFVFQGEVDYWALFKLLSVPLTQTGRDWSSLAWVPRADLHPPEMPLNEQNIHVVTPDSQGKAGIASGFYQPHKKAPKWAGSGWVWAGGTQSLPFVLKLLGQLLCKASPSQTLQITIFFSHMILNLYILTFPRCMPKDWRSKTVGIHSSPRRADSPSEHPSKPPSQHP